MYEGSTARSPQDRMVKLPCGKEISQAENKEFSRRFYMQTLKLSLQLNRKERWRIINVMVDTEFSSIQMCRTAFEHKVSFQGKSLCELACPLDR